MLYTCLAYMYIAQFFHWFLVAMQAVLEDIKNHEESLTSVTTLGHSMMDGASSEDAAFVDEKLAQLAAEFDALRERVTERQKVLEEGLVQVRM